MKRSESIKELAAAILLVQHEVPTISKGETASVRMKSGGTYTYKYAPLDAVWDACKASLKKNGITVIQSAEMVGEHMKLETLLHHTSEQWIETTFMLPMRDLTPQGAGSAGTYARRYGLMLALNLIAADDDDAAKAQTGVLGESGSMPIAPNKRPQWKPNGKVDEINWSKTDLPRSDGTMVYCPRCDSEVDGHWYSDKGNWISTCMDCKWGYGHPVDIRDEVLAPKVAPKAKKEKK